MKAPSIQRSVDPQTFAIGVLSITACILFVGFLLLAVTPRVAEAESMNDRAGDFLMVTNRLSESRESVLVMDAASKQVRIYIWDAGRREVVLSSSLNYAALDEAIEARRQRERRR